MLQVAELESMGEVMTNNDNQTVSVSNMGGSAMVTSYAEEAMIITPDVQACGSIVQIIDHLLLPNFEEEGLSASI